MAPSHNELNDQKLECKEKIALICGVLSDPTSVDELYKALVDEGNSDQNIANAAVEKRWAICNLEDRDADRFKQEMAKLTDDNAKKAKMIQLLYLIMLANLNEYNNLKKQTPPETSPDTSKFFLPLGMKKEFFEELLKIPGTPPTSVDEFNKIIASLPKEMREKFNSFTNRMETQRLYAQFVTYGSENAIPDYTATFAEAEKQKRLSPNWGWGDKQTPITKESVVQLDRQVDYHPTGTSSATRVNLMRVKNSVLSQKDMINLIYNDFDYEPNSDKVKIKGVTNQYAGQLNGQDNFASQIFFKISSDPKAPVWRICAKDENGYTVFYKFKLEDWEANKGSMSKDQFLASPQFVQPMFGTDFDRSLCKKDGSALDKDGLKYCKTVRQAVGETPRHTCELAKKNVIDAGANVIQHGPGDGAGVQVKKQSTRTGASAFSAQAGTTQPNSSSISVGADGNKFKPN